jgi:CheY-like chemotaxis protein
MSHTRRILIVEDDSEARTVLSIALGTLRDVSIDTAMSAEEALPLIERGGIDVLVTDVRMGGMSGLELLARVRPMIQAAIVISGETSPSIERMALEAGAAAYFPKPFSAAAVRQRISSLLESLP